MRIVKFPIIIVAAGSGSAYATSKKIDDLSVKFPIFEKLKDYVPGKEQIDNLETSILDSYTSVKEKLNRSFDYAKFGELSLFEKENLVETTSEKAKESEERSVQLKELYADFVKSKAEYQKSLEDLKKENEELRSQLLLRSSKNTQNGRINRSLIDMYSEVLDELSHLDSEYDVQDQLPRVVVIGDQSSGKTSVLEMIAQARIFPRGSGEMMTKSPVQVTLSEGAYHVASFKDSTREYDLTKESELAALRAEIELRMKALVPEGKTISSEVISLNVKGPGLQRMVLVDLPGIISTVTTGMDPETRLKIIDLAEYHMKNPNAIILCIQDGSIDAERSNVTQFVSNVDPQGRRTIFVLTKVDLAESNLYNPNRIKQILEGSLFPMKALGYFAVVTGKGSKDETIQDIQKFEEEFFSKSRLFREGTLRLNQMSTANLSKAVSERFWKTVKDSVEQQADMYRALLYSRETEWRNTFHGQREMDRSGLFERGRIEILDDLSVLGAVSSIEWERELKYKLWSRIEDNFFENIYNQVAQLADYGHYMTKVDIFLKEWQEKRDSLLPSSAINTGRETLYGYLNEISKKAVNNSTDDIFTNLRDYVYKETKKRHKWDNKASDRLQVIQRTALEDRILQNKVQWDDTIKFMLKIFEQRLVKLNSDIEDLKGPNWIKRWTKWSNRTDDQHLNLLIINELETVLSRMASPSLNLLQEDLTAAIRNIKNKNNLDLSDKTGFERIEKIYGLLVRRTLLERSKQVTNDWKSGFYYYQQSIIRGPSHTLVQNSNKLTDDTNDPRDIVLFGRIHKMLLATVQALRQQIMNEESTRMESKMKEILDEISNNPVLLKDLIKGKRVQLAEDIKRIKYIQAKLEEFIEALNDSSKH